MFDNRVQSHLLQQRAFAWEPDLKTERSDTLYYTVVASIYMCASESPLYLFDFHADAGGLQKQGASQLPYPIPSGLQGACSFTEIVGWKHRLSYSLLYAPLVHRLPSLQAGTGTS